MTPHQPIENIRIVLQGLAVGDAFGDQFLRNPETVEQEIYERVLPSPIWDVTDDTVMACGIAECLLESGEIQEDALAEVFARNYQADIRRGYGGTAHSILRGIGEGIPWQQASSQVFGGTGSMGNGAAMRVAPLGAFFPNQPERIVEEAAKSARVTHWHPEAQAGAIATALAVGWATAARLGKQPELSFFEAILKHTPDSDLSSKVAKAASLPASYDVRTAVSALGNGSKMLATDTVPFVLWCANRCMEDFEEAMWLTVAGLGDRDTTCAMVGGIVAARLGVEGIPKEWLQSVERLGIMFGWERIFAGS